MANDLNQCQFIGRLGKDVDLRYMPSGDAVAAFSIAVGWKSKDKEGVEWVNITAFGKLAEICGQYLRKGSQVFIQGRFKTEKYEKDGQTRYSTKIIADRMQMLGSKDNGDGNRNSGDSRQGSSSRHSDDAGYDDGFNDDIPF